MFEIDRICNMDCVHGMSLLDDDSIDLTVTSPPYDNLRNYNGYSFDFDNVSEQLYRVTKPGGVLVWVVSDATIKGSETGTSFRQALHFKELGFLLHDTMIYQKHNPTPNTGNNTRYQQCFEYMFVFSKGKPKTTNLILEDRHNECNDKRTFRIKTTNRKSHGEFDTNHFVPMNDTVPRQNIFSYKVGLYNTTSDKIAFEHPAIFPEQLAYDHIFTWSNPGDVVLDPFLGSGTVSKVAKLTDRHYIGFEISEEYVKIANTRLNTSPSFKYYNKDNNQEALF